MTKKVLTKFVNTLLLWPVLWWGFSTAMYCAESSASSVSSVVENSAPPVPLALDLSRVSESAIAQTVRHLQLIVHAAEARAETLETNLAAEHANHLAAQNETATLQIVVDVANARAAKAEADAVVQRQWKWRWFWMWSGTVALVAAFFIARQYVPFLKLL